MDAQMNSFQEFLFDYGPQQFAIGLPIQIILCSVVILFVVRVAFDLEPKISVWRCVLCAIFLNIIATLCILIMALPIPLVFLLAGAFFLIGSVFIIRVAFELPDGGLSIFIVYLLTLILVQYFTRYYLR